MLHARIIAGAGAGESHCLICMAGGQPLAVSFVKSTDEKAALYAKRLDELATRHERSRLLTALVFIGDAAADEARIAQIGESQNLERVSLAVPAEPEELAAWQLDETHPANAYIVRAGKIAKHFAAECPICNKLPGRLSAALWRMLAAGRGTWGAVEYRAPAMAQHRP